MGQRDGGTSYRAALTQLRLRPKASAGRLRAAILARPLLLTAIVGLLFGVPLFVSAQLDIDASRAQLQAAKLDQQRLATQAAADIVAQRVHGIEQSLVAAAAATAVRDASVRRDAVALGKLLGDYRPLIGLHTDVLAFWIEDERGILLGIDPPNPTLIGKDFSKRDYFVGVAQRWSPFVSEAFVGAVAGNPPTTSIAVPVFSADGAPIGVMGVALEFTQMADWFAPVRSSLDDLYLVDRHGRLMVRFSRPTSDPLRDLSADPTVAAELVGRPTLGVVADPLGAGPRLVSTTAVADLDWHVIAVSDPEPAVAAVTELAADLLIVRVVLILALLGLLYSVARLYRRVRLSEGVARAAETAAETANRRKSEFLANMSHELRTPLNAIIGFSSLLAEQLTGVSDRQRHYLSNIEDAGEHLLGLINDVLDLSKVEAGRVEIRPERIALDALVGPVDSAMRTAAQSRGVEFDAVMPAQAEVMVDPARTRQVLYNLLSNAVKFTPRGGQVLLLVTLRGDDLEMEVRDTGIGIPPEKHDRVFGTFERLHEGQYAASGTGLGLALTKHLVELHGGTIGFESRAGVGTTFRVVLPGVVVAAPPADRLLVVEDQRSDADLIAALAAPHELPVEIVASLADARAALRRARPLGIVLDLRLPDARGEELLADLGGSPELAAIPVVIVTVEDDDTRRHAHPGVDVITKPVDRMRLDRWLRSLARHRRSEVDDAIAIGG